MDSGPEQSPGTEDDFYMTHDLEPMPTWRRVTGLGMLLIAAALTFVAGVIFVLPMLRATVEPPPPTEAVQVATEVPATAAPLVIEPGAPPATLSPDQIAALLATPPVEVAEAGGPIARQDTPFTIIPERPRGEVFTYTVRDGDTISGIAERFDLKEDTIAWSNDRDVVFALRPGATMNILPVDGVYHRVLVPQSIQSIADEYNVEAYDIINSEFNNLFGSTPETMLPSGMYVVVPGGTSTANNWQYNPVVERSGSGASGGGGSGNGQYISFARGEPGSCGVQPNPGGTGFFGTPMAGGTYTWVRGFSLYHTGVDIASVPGTNVLASSPGRVIYAGWNNWGYGYLVVLAHGPFTSFYAHMSRINVGCGQMVGAGQIVGGVGSTGNSSGPHLHFEIRYNDIPQNPTSYVGF